MQHLPIPWNILREKLNIIQCLCPELFPSSLKIVLLSVVSNQLYLRACLSCYTKRKALKPKCRELNVKTVALLMIFFFVAFTLAGCLYAHVTVPLSTELNKTELGQKLGKSSTYSVIWLFAWGDGGAAKAAQKGGITVMTHMDRELLSIFFGIYTRTTTIVYGD
jgi:hypothetical protein